MNVKIILALIAGCICAPSLGRRMGEFETEPREGFFGFCKNFFDKVQILSLESILKFVLNNSFQVATIPKVPCTQCPNITATTSTTTTTSTTSTTTTSTPSTTTTATTSTGAPGTTPDPTKPIKCGNPIDLVVLLDSSGSINNVGYKTSLQFTAGLAESWIADKNRVSVLIFSSSTKWLFSLSLGQSVLLSPEQVRMKIEQAPHLDELTFTHIALQMGLKHHQDYSNDASVSKKVLVITDGNSDYRDETIRAAKALHKANIEVYSIGVGSLDLTELEEIVNFKKQNLFNASNYSSVKQLLRSVSSAVCGSQ